MDSKGTWRLLPPGKAARHVCPHQWREDRDRGSASPVGKAPPPPSTEVQDPLMSPAPTQGGCQPGRAGGDGSWPSLRAPHPQRGPGEAGNHPLPQSQVAGGCHRPGWSPRERLVPGDPEASWSSGSSAFHAAGKGGGLGVTLPAGLTPDPCPGPSPMPPTPLPWIMGQACPALV